MSITQTKQKNLEFLQFYNTSNSLFYFNDICSPIKNFIPGEYDIVYARVYNDNSISILRTKTKWLIDWIINFDQFDGTLFQERIKKAANSINNVYCAWNYIKEDVLLDFNHKHNILQGFDIYKRKKDYVEFWGFVIKSEMPLFHDFCINNIKVIEELTDNCSKRIDLLKEIFFAKRALLNLQIDLSFSNNTFTNREIECARLIIDGKKTKEIAQNLSISPKTVEVYIGHLKQKTGCIY